MVQHYVFLVLVFLLSLAWFSTAHEIPTLTTLEELNQTEFGHHFPRHGLKLLHWFVQSAIKTDNENVDMVFDPRMRLFGFHEYHNHQLRLPLLNNSLSYQVVGDLDTQNHPGARALPWYIKQDYLYVRSQYFSVSELQKANCERLIISFDSTDWGVKAVYLIDISSPAAIQQLSNALLAEIQSHTLESFLNFFSFDLRYCATGKDSESETCSELFSKGTRLEVKTNSNGHAQMTWSHLPWAENDQWVGLYADDSKSNGDRLAWHNVSTQRGVFQTAVDMNPGLQIRLLKDKTHSLFNGEELDEACRETPKQIPGFKAYLQLYTENGYACARLYIDKSFTNWRERLHNAWIGFYSSKFDHSKKYRNFQWVSKFWEDKDLHPYVVLRENCWGGRLSWGVQARFFPNKSYNDVVRTPHWKC
ncbi:uncharacterized protein [Lepisosteus oculatus]|nr:PREDICTED: uncharacterized protein LOC107079964 isoform X2 [Lepisosteus oculatus]